ncbi:hypothetical protein MKZ38_010277 [Zalerion maritima]|uniref:Uncharacterized protein n=1 Tax=Zalerion maritima TaxID=339359 RepID=A0AAD5RFH8_9PEZI|nr:hypothetical protein MKZ38_010277 [Zalerion maritima]
MLATTSQLVLLALSSFAGGGLAKPFPGASGCTNTTADAASEDPVASWLAPPEDPTYPFHITIPGSRRPAKCVRTIVALPGNLPGQVAGAYDQFYDIYPWFDESSGERYGGDGAYLMKWHRYCVSVEAVGADGEDDGETGGGDGEGTTTTTTTAAAAAATGTATKAAATPTLSDLSTPTAEATGA